MSQKRCETCAAWSDDENLLMKERCADVYSSARTPSGCQYWTAKETIDINKPPSGGSAVTPPLRLITSAEAKAIRENQPQVIQRVKGAKYILELERGADGRRIYHEELEGIAIRFKEWLDGDIPFLILDRPSRISVILLPEEGR